MKAIQTRRFDAVSESRRWKEAVAHQTKGLPRDEVLAFFKKDRALTALRQMRESAAESSKVQEAPSDA